MHQISSNTRPHLHLGGFEAASLRSVIIAHDFGAPAFDLLVTLLLYTNICLNLTKINTQIKQFIYKMLETTIKNTI